MERLIKAMAQKERINNNDLVEWAHEQAESLLTPLGNRWLHVQGVAKQAQWISKILNSDDQIYLIAAAYLHDIGYAPELKKTGFHPLDGAYYLQSKGQNRLASLVAYHSEAQFEAELRGSLTKLMEFPREYSDVADALTYCDMTTASTGQKNTFEERVTDILNRYGATDLVTHTIKLAIPSLEIDIKRIEQKLHEQCIESKP